MNTTKKARHRSDPAETLLDTDPFEEDLDVRPASAPERRTPGPTVLLVAGLVAVAGFIGGVQAHKAWGGEEGGAQAPAAQGSGQNGRSQGGLPQGSAPGSGSGPSGGLTAGTVTRVEDGVVHVKTSDGRTARVEIGDSTRITVSERGSAEDLKSGTNVVVQGETADDGTITASTVTEGGGTGGFGGMRPRNEN